MSSIGKIFDESLFSRYSDGAKPTSIPLPSIPIISGDACDSQRTSSNVEYEETINSMKLQQNALIDELKRLREVYDQTKSDSLDQIRQLKSLEDFYTNQTELSTSEYFEYLIKIFNLFQHLRGQTDNHIDSTISTLDDLKCQLNQQIHYFSTLDKSLLSNPPESNGTKPPVNSLPILLSKYEQRFSHLFAANNQPNNSMMTELDETMENENNNDDELDLISNEDFFGKKFSNFLNEIYEKLKNLLREKNESEEKLIFLEEKRLTYSRWESQMYDILKWINEEKSARSHLKGLANKMAEELDQIRESTSPLLTIGSTSSSMNTAGTSLGHNTVSISCERWREMMNYFQAWKHGRSVKLKHMEIQQLQTSLQKEIEAKQRIHEDLKESQAENILKAE